MRDPADMSHAELVAEVRYLRALVASHQAAGAGGAAAGGAAPAGQPVSQSGLSTGLAQDLGLPDEAIPGVGHELRNTLNIVLGVIEGLISESYGPLNGRQLHALELAERSAYRLVALLT